MTNQLLFEGSNFSWPGLLSFGKFVIVPWTLWYLIINFQSSFLDTNEMSIVVFMNVWQAYHLLTWSPVEDKYHQMLSLMSFIEYMLPSSVESVDIVERYNYNESHRSFDWIYVADLRISKLQQIYIHLCRNLLVVENRRSG